MDLLWQDAITRGDAEIARDLIARGVDIDARDRYGQTALMVAAKAGHYEVAESLMAAGAALNATAKFGLTALMLAVVAGHVEIARLLATAGADLSMQGTGAPGFAGKTARDLAADRGMIELLPLLTPKT